jgi:hypothetical protein
MAKSEVEKCIDRYFPEEYIFSPTMELDGIEVMIKSGFIDSEVYRELEIKKKKELAGPFRILSGVAISEKRAILGIVTFPKEIIDQTIDSPNEFRWIVRDEIAAQLFQDDHDKKT